MEIKKLALREMSALSMNFSIVLMKENRTERLMMESNST